MGYQDYITFYLIKYDYNSKDSHQVDVDPEELGNIVFQNFPTITQDLSRRSIETSVESVSTYPRRPKAEAFCHTPSLAMHLD